MSTLRDMPRWKVTLLAVPTEGEGATVREMVDSGKIRYEDVANLTVARTGIRPAIVDFGRVGKRRYVRVVTDAEVLDAASFSALLRRDVQGAL